MFELKARDGLGRIGILHTRHQDVDTPAVLPVINPNQMIISPSEMKKLFGVKMVITNAYIIHKDDALREQSEKSGVHELLDFDGAIMTDSGTFQTHVYKDVEVDPLQIVDFQKRIGSDVGTILDVFSEIGDDEDKVREDMNETLRRAAEAVNIKGDMALALTVQGGNFPEIRRYCAQRLSELKSELYPIGGVVPLMESYRYREIVDIIIASKKGLSPGKAVHLFGCGHPMFLGLAVLLGCDLFDSASYVKFAKDGRLLFSDGTRRLTEMMELPCSCPVCSENDVNSLQKSHKEGDYKPLAMHNLYVIFAEIAGIKQSIYEGRLWEYVEVRARNHPSLLSALKKLRRYKKYLERFENTSKSSAFFYTGPESIHRPIVYRYEKRFFERYRHPKMPVQIGFEEGPRPYSKYYKNE
ncbi:MAG: tRNA guanosine(15) transglycosylase TgtA, partial [Methanomassiliicoccales archaeon]